MAARGQRSRPPARAAWRGLCARTFSSLEKGIWPPAAGGWPRAVTKAARCLRRLGMEPAGEKISLWVLKMNKSLEKNAAALNPNLNPEQTLPILTSRKLKAGSAGLARRPSSPPVAASPRVGPHLHAVDLHQRWLPVRGHVWNHSKELTTRTEPGAEMRRRELLGCRGSRQNCMETNQQRHPAGPRRASHRGTHTGCWALRARAVTDTS